MNVNKERARKVWRLLHAACLLAFVYFVLGTTTERLVVGQEVGGTVTASEEFQPSVETDRKIAETLDYAMFDEDLLMPQLFDGLAAPYYFLRKKEYDSVIETLEKRLSAWKFQRFEPPVAVETDMSGTPVEAPSGAEEPSGQEGDASRPNASEYKIKDAIDFGNHLYTLELAYEMSGRFEEAEKLGRSLWGSGHRGDVEYSWFQARREFASERYQNVFYMVYFHLLLRSYPTLDEEDVDAAIQEAERYRKLAPQKQEYSNYVPATLEKDDPLLYFKTIEVYRFRQNCARIVDPGLYYVDKPFGSQEARFAVTQASHDRYQKFLDVMEEEYQQTLKDEESGKIGPNSSDFHVNKAARERAIKILRKLGELPF